eukprot:gene24411-30755_t
MRQTLPTPSTAAKVIITADNDSTDEERSSTASRCFSLVDGRVTSLVSTPDGAYLFAGFSSGAVRVFDLTEGGVTGPEDRLGNQVGRIEASSSSSGALKVHMQIGGHGSGATQSQSSSSPRSAASDVVTVSASAVRPTACCHLFAGARLGSSTMLAIDVGSLRDTKQKRGFITMAGGGVQVFRRTDARLKGFTALSTLFVSAAASASEEGGSGEYTAKYRLVTGRGFCSYHVWEVLLTARYDASAHSLRYSDSWSVVVSGNVNGPTLTFAHFVSRINHTVSGDDGFHSFYTKSVSVNNINCSSSGGGETELCVILSSDELLHCAQDKEVRCVTLITDVVANGDATTNGTQGSSEDLMLLEDGGVAVEIVNSNDSTSTNSNNDKKDVLTLHKLRANKPSVLKGCTEVWTASIDGCVLFCGTDELTVVLYAPSNGETNTAGGVVSRARYSLSQDNNGGSGRATSRHLRVLEQVTCTADGQYALILCSDNTVYLYSVIDVLSRGISGSDATRGFLTLLFQCNEAYRLELGISYALEDNSTSGSTTLRSEDGAVTSEVVMNGVSAESILLSVSYWRISCPASGGVLKTCRLLTSRDTFLSNTTSTHEVVPVLIAIPGVGLYDANTTNNPSRRPAVNSTTCLLCGDGCAKHWADCDVEINEDLISPNNTNGRATTARKATQNGSKLTSSKDGSNHTKSSRNNGAQHSTARSDDAEVSPRVEEPSFSDEDEEEENLSDTESDHTGGEEEDDEVNLKRLQRGSAEKKRKSAVDGEVISLLENEEEEEAERATEIKNKNKNKRTKVSHTDDMSDFIANDDTASAAQLRSLRAQLKRTKDENASHAADIAVLRDEVVFTQAEMDRIMRRADVRFAAEKSARRQWSAEKGGLVEQVAALQREKLVLEDAANKATTRVADIAHTLKLLTSVISGEDFTSSSSSSEAGGSSGGHGGVNLLAPPQNTTSFLDDVNELIYTAVKSASSDDFLKNQREINLSVIEYFEIETIRDVVRPFFNVVVEIWSSFKNAVTVLWNSFDAFYVIILSTFVCVVIIQVALKYVSV